MSVLVESLSVVIRRVILDTNYPGGATAYLETAVAEGSPARRACADGELTAVSFVAPEDASAWIGRLAGFGIVHIANDKCADIACVDQDIGPTMPCDWIEWRRHPAGFTYCWLAGTSAGDVAAPENRATEQSQRRARRDAAEQPGHLLPLAVEDGLEYWLDLETGRQVVALPERAPAAANGSSSDIAATADSSEPSLLDIVRDAIATLEWEPDRSDSTSLRVRIAGRSFGFSLIVVADEAARTCVCYGLLPVRVQDNRRQAIAELIARINYRLRLGSFDLDFSDGEVRYRTGCDVEGGTLTRHMVLTVLGNVCASVDRYGRAVMRVLYGGASPEEAAEEVLSDESD